MDLSGMPSATFIGRLAVVAMWRSPHGPARFMAEPQVLREKREKESKTRGGRERERKIREEK